MLTYLEHKNSVRRDCSVIDGDVHLTVYRRADSHVTDVALYIGKEVVARATWELREWNMFHVITEIPENFRYMCEEMYRKYDIYVPTTGNWRK